MSQYLSDPRWSVDWVRLVGNLRASGMSLQDIAAAARVSKTQVGAYASEDLRQRPEHSAGERLIALWCQVLGYRRDDLPMHRHPLSVALANDARGDPTTRETALRQAQALITKLNLQLDEKAPEAAASAVPSVSSPEWVPYWAQRTTDEAMRAGVRTPVLCRNGWLVAG